MANYLGKTGNLNFILYAIFGLPKSSVIYQLRQKLMNTAAKYIEQAKEKDPGENFLIHYLIGQIPDEQIIKEAMLLLFAGHDTTAHALSWAIYCLITNPNCMTKVRLELERFPVIDQNSVTKMEYLNLVWKETLRLYPPSPIGTVRLLTEDITLGKFTLPKGTNVAVPPYASHRNPKGFKDPDTFNPDRWREEQRKENPGIWMPFSKGERNCVGQPLATLEGPLVLGIIIQQLKLRLSPNVEVKSEFIFTLKPGGLLLDVDSIEN